MKKISIEFITPQQARLGEPGDWYFDAEGNLIVRCVNLGNWRYNLLLARHEMDEALLCKHAGITAEDVDKDQVYAQQHPELENNPDSFSGYPGSVLQNQHNDALAAEWILSRLLGVDWQQYAAAYDKAEEACNGNETANERKTKSDFGGSKQRQRTPIGGRWEY